MAVRREPSRDREGVVDVAQGRAGGLRRKDTMRTIKLTLAYDGTAYAGWQIQPGETTLQETLEAALLQITGESIRTLASGRTDAGVHALGQVVGFQTQSRLSPDVLRRALNAVLPLDMAVLEAVEVDESFHPIRDAVQKRYRYTIHDGPVRDVFARAYSWHYDRRLDAEAMHRAAQVLLGTHDFSAFETAGAPRKSSVRTITEIGVRRAGDCPLSPPDFIVLEVEADGFLYNMVRAIAGSLVEIGRGAETEDWLREVLQSADRRRAGPTAPPQGLCLLSVGY